MALRVYKAFSGPFPVDLKLNVECCLFQIIRQGLPYEAKGIDRGSGGL